jgi:hypothetical protein
VSRQQVQDATCQLRRWHRCCMTGGDDICTPCKLGAVASPMPATQAVKKPDASHTGCEEDTATATNGCCNVCRAAGGRAPQHSCNQPICRQRHKGNGCVIASAHAGDGWVTQPASCIAVRLLEHLPADCKQGAVLSYLNQDAYRKHDAERSLPAQYQSAPSDVRGPCHNPDPHELHPKPEPQQSPNWPKQRDLTLRIQH